MGRDQPHQSGVKGEGGEGLRELRPTSGRTLIRPVYRRFKNLYVILAIGPEAQVDPGEFAKTVKRVQQRRVEITE